MWLYTIVAVIQCVNVVISAYLSNYMVTSVNDMKPVNCEVYTHESETSLPAALGCGRDCNTVTQCVFFTLHDNRCIMCLMSDKSCSPKTFANYTGQIYMKEESNPIISSTCGSPATVLSQYNNNGCLVCDVNSIQNYVIYNVSGSIQYISSGSAGTWAVTSTNDVVYRSGTTWQHVSSTPQMDQIGVGPTVWAVSQDRKLYYRQGISIMQPTGTVWQHVSSVPTCAVSVSSKGNVCIYCSGSGYIRTGITDINPLGLTWKSLTGTIDSITVGPSGVYATEGARVFYYTNSYGEPSFINGLWTPVSDGFPFNHIKSGKDIIWGVTPSNELYYRAGVSSSQPKGTSWVQLSLLGPVNKFDVSGCGIWVIY